MSAEPNLWDRITWRMVLLLMWLAKWRYLEIKRDAHKDAGEMAGFRK